MNLPLEIKLHIAELDAEAFQKWIVSDSEFYDFLIHHPRVYDHLKRQHTKITRVNGMTRYTLFGNLHRDDDQPALIYPDGTKEWWIHGRLIRRVGPPLNDTRIQRATGPAFIPRLPQRQPPPPQAGNQYPIGLIRRHQ